jgi:hypothetical protein
MGERALRGSRLGAVSYETEHPGELAPRQIVGYRCPDGHHVSVPLAEEADVPGTWECRTCGLPALRVDVERPEPKIVKPVRTHWDMLMERRTTAELEALLAERLAVLRERPATTSRRKSA